MPKLIHAIFVKNEAHCIENMLKSVLPCVDASYVLIDDMTTDKTKEILDDYGCNTKLFKFENFAKTKNTLLQWVNNKCDWLLGIAPDETIEPAFGKMVRTLIDKAEATELDAFYFPRRHWADVDKTVLDPRDKVWYPDKQARLLRSDFPRIHMVRYVHEVVSGVRKSMFIKDNDIHHFNCYWKKQIDYDWEAMNKLYKSLDVLHKKEGGKNIWPDQV